jgi:diamine N-acetyltransferase
MINPFLIGERLYLRPLELEDLERCQRWFNDPEVRRFLSSIRPLNQIVERAFLEDLSKKAADPAADVIMAIVIKEDDGHIGNTGLHRINVIDRSAEFGIAIGEKDFWRKGWGTETARLMVQYGFSTLNLNRIYLRVHDNNPRGLGAYEKAGFRQEGILRQALFRDGQYHEVILMSLLRDEFRP